MIIFEPGGSKNLILVILVVFFTSLIAWQWIVSDPFSGVNKNNYFLSQIKDNTGDELQGVKDSLEQGKEDLNQVNEELVKQVQQEQLIEETKKYLEDKENVIEVMPKNQIDCELVNGQWDEEISKCLLATADAGQECSDSSQCQGYCAADLPEIYNKFISEGQSVEINGICSDNVFKYGCLAIVHEGFVNEIVCIN